MITDIERDPWKESYWQLGVPLGASDLILPVQFMELRNQALQLQYVHPKRDLGVNRLGEAIGVLVETEIMGTPDGNFVYTQRTAEEEIPRSTTEIETVIAIFRTALEHRQAAAHVRAARQKSPSFS